MYKRSILILSAIFLLLAAVMFLVTEAQASFNSKDNLTFNLDFDPVEGEISYETCWGLNLNESTIIDVYVSDIPHFGLRHMGFTIEYDPTKLTIVNHSVSIDATWLDDDNGLEVDPVKGKIKMYGGMKGAAISSDDTKLGTFELQCIALGTSDLLLFDSDHGGIDYDAPFDDFILLQGTVIDDQISSGIFMGTINSVPIPGSFLLLACGLLGMAVLKRERS